MAVTDSLRRLSCFEQLTQQGRGGATDPPVAEIPIDTSPQAQPEVSIPEVVASEPQAETIATGLGSEQLRSSRSEAGEVRVTAMVREVTRDSRRYLYFHFENGQVWRQIEREFVPYPRDRAFQVEIDQGMMGEYRLRVEGEGRMVRIRRVE